MKTKLLLASAILFFIGCDKNTLPKPTTEVVIDKRILRLNEVSATAPSGAEIGYFFTYKDSLPIKVIYRNKNVATDTVKYIFNYIGTNVSSIDAFTSISSTTNIPDRKLVAYYANSRISKVEFWYQIDQALTLGNYIEYIYDINGRMTTKNAYIKISGSMQLFLIHHYTYGFNNNIAEILTQGQGVNQGFLMKFENSFDYNDNNLFFQNNPAMRIFIWYLFDLNELIEGLLDTHIFSPNNAKSTIRTYEGISKNFNFNMFLGNNLWDNSYSYPNPYSTNDILFQKIKFIYKLMP